MKSTRIGAILFAALALALGSGCGPKDKPISDLQRKEAEHLIAEASFAQNMKDWPRAEALIANAARLAPDTGIYWLSLGSMRVRLNNKAGAKDAYQNGLKAYEKAAAKEENKDDPDPWLKQMQLLALLGRIDEARAMLAKTEKRFPTQRNVRAFVDSKAFDKMIADPIFKQGAL